MSAPTVRLVSEEVGEWNRRFGVELADGARVEAVLYRGDSLCISSQVGCAVGCPFCASGAWGLGRNLSLEELRAQLEQVEARGHKVERVTLSGVGEPLHNLRAVAPFLQEMHDRRTPASLTTSGGPLKFLEELLRAPHNGVTLSVHAGQESTRARLVPRGPALAPLFEALKTILPTLSGSRRKKVAFAYLALEGENDSEDEVDAFIERVLPFGRHVYLFAYNPVSGSARRRLSRDRYQAIYDRMREAGLVARMSSQARIESNGGCGTLVALRTSGERPQASTNTRSE